MLYIYHPDELELRKKSEILTFMNVCRMARMLFPHEVTFCVSFNFKLLGNSHSLDPDIFTATIFSLSLHLACSYLYQSPNWQFLPSSLFLLMLVENNCYILCFGISSRCAQSRIQGFSFFIQTMRLSSRTRARNS